MCQRGKGSRATRRPFQGTGRQTTALISLLLTKYMVLTTKWMMKARIWTDLTPSLIQLLWTLSIWTLEKAENGM